MEKKAFTELGLSAEVLRAVEKMGFELASPIQTASIPVLLSGKDMVGQSQTGSGKTAAFGVPVVERVTTERRPQAIILCPTRELAAQVAEEIAKISAFKKGIRELPLVGGQSYDRQFRALRDGAQIIIGTPGRVLDHLDRGSLDLAAVRMVVLDEADRMLDMGFRDDIEKILSMASPDRQTVLFSATLPPPIKKMIEKFTRTPALVKIESESGNMTGARIEQSYIECRRESRIEVLCRVLDLYDVKYGIIFGFTKAQVDETTETLMARGYACDRLHGDMAQNMRERVMRRFREKKIELLVATDVAARGLDVNDLEMVINLELPQDPEDYVHRIGRTGRAGKSGRAVSLVCGREFGRLQSILRVTKAKMRRDPVPKLSDLEQRANQRLLQQVTEVLETGEFAVNDTFLAQLLDAGHSPNQVALACLSLLNKEAAITNEEIMEDRPGRGSDRFSGGGDDRRGHGREERPGRGGSAGHGHEERPVRGGRFEREERFAPRGGRDSGGRFGEREDRGERRPRPERSSVGMVSLRLNVGKKHRILPKDIVGCFAHVAGLDGSQIGAIRLGTEWSNVDVAEAAVDAVVDRVSKTKLKGVVLRVTEERR